MKKLFFFACVLLSLNVFGQTHLQPLRLGIIVNNVDSATHWYEKNLGFEVYKKMSFPEYDGLKINFLKCNKFEIELVEKKTSLSVKQLKPDYDNNKTPLQGIMKLAFEVDNIHQLFNQFKKEKQIKFVIELSHDKAFDVDFFMMEDLDGNLLQFIGKK
jgi:catechol 2,3-dioxygenase-like lactoylglutathione lyase family enzyme